MKAELFLRAGAALAEGPVWRDGRLLWVDLSRGEIHLTSQGGADEAHSLGKGAVGFAVYRRNGGIVAGCQDGLYLYDLSTREAAPYLETPGMTPDLRYNDGKCDPRGRLYGGTMARGKSSPTGQLYRITPSGAESVSAGLIVSNGLGWSPDASVMYHIDSQAHCVWAYDYDIETASMANRRDLCPIADGVPDGMCVDAEGGLWVAVWDGSRVEHIAPDGRKLGAIDVPAHRASSCCFGGPGLRTLFITSASRDDDELGGSIFACEPGVPGLEVSDYNG